MCPLRSPAVSTPDHVLHLLDCYSHQILWMCAQLDIVVSAFNICEGSSREPYSPDDSKPYSPDDSTGFIYSGYELSTVAASETWIGYSSRVCSACYTEPDVLDGPQYRLPAGNLVRAYPCSSGTIVGHLSPVLDLPLRGEALLEQR